jgi:toxin ParE1/3/4
MPASRNVIWSSAARRDMQGIYFHIAQFSPSSADDFTLDLYCKIQSLAELGLTGSLPPGLGNFIRVFTYRDRRFFVRVSDQSLTVLRVMHGRQNISPEDFPESDP